MPPNDAALDRVTGEGQRRAWAWAAALREGATTPWHEWSGTGEAFRPRLPGAQQLELLRRLNLAASRAGREVPVRLADRILAAGVSGRGRGDLGLIGADPDQRFGPRPVDPGTLPDEELLRVAAGLIADDVAATGVGAEPDRSLIERVRAVRRPWVPSYVIVGSQWLVEPCVDDLVARGHRPGGRQPMAYLLADDLASVIAHAWTARAFDQGGQRWPAFLEGFAQAGHLPPRADLARMARSAARRYGAGRVTVVLDPSQLADRLGVRALAAPPRLGAHAVDLVRRVGEPLGLLVPTEQRPALLRATLARRLDGRGGPSLTIPRRWDTWLRTQAERIHHEIAAAGYPVLGDLDRLLPGPLVDDAVLPDDAEVLALAVGLLLDPMTPRPAAGPTTEEGS
ncbi:MULTISPECIES: hypothetical protein [Nocardioides]|uniref:Uncharacterized protein n=1 Tax=Nocardioides vastitatis TaxID=2568655 RepID=A0ABW0ZHB6_9ACTN|nr:hypothetical protein [Nocardioides sp.]THJ04652.1 hypothetical protein E7Z54_08080 [Nocardioides sp.]